MIYVKVVNKKGGSGYLFETESVVWDPVQSVSDAEKFNALQLYDANSELGTLTGVWIGLDNEKDFIFDVNKFEVYVLGEHGETIDRIP